MPKIAEVLPPEIRQVKDCPGYLVGDDGSLWTKLKTRGKRNGGRGVESYISDEMQPMKLRDHNQGYQQAAFRVNGKYAYFLVHRLVLETFVGPCPDGMECLHDDGDKTNNNLWNISWGTRERNVQDSIRHGTFYNATKAAAIANRGRRVTEEVKAKIRAGHVGKPKSSAHRESIRRTHWSKGPLAAEILARIAATKLARR